MLFSISLSHRGTTEEKQRTGRPAHGAFPILQFCHNASIRCSQSHPHKLLVRVQRAIRIRHSTLALNVVPEGTIQAHLLERLQVGWSKETKEGLEQLVNRAVRPCNFPMLGVAAPACRPQGRLKCSTSLAQLFWRCLRLGQRVQTEREPEADTYANGGAKVPSESS